MEVVLLPFQSWTGKDNKIVLFSMMLITNQPFNNHLQLKRMDTNMVFLLIWRIHQQKYLMLEVEIWLLLCNIFREKVIWVNIKRQNLKKQESSNKVPRRRLSIKERSEVLPIKMLAEVTENWLTTSTRKWNLATKCNSIKQSKTTSENQC